MKSMFKTGLTVLAAALSFAAVSALAQPSAAVTEDKAQLKTDQSTLKTDKSVGKLAAESKGSEKIYQDKQLTKADKNNIASDKAALKVDQKKPFDKVATNLVASHATIHWAAGLNHSKN